MAKEQSEIGRQAGHMIGDAIRQIVKVFESLETEEARDACYLDMLTKQVVDVRGDVGAAMSRYAEVFRVNEIRVRDERWPDGMVPAEEMILEMPTAEQSAAAMVESFGSDIEQNWATERQMSFMNDQVPNNTMDIVFFLDQLGWRRVAQLFAVGMDFWEVNWDGDEFWKQYTDRHDEMFGDN